MAALVPAARKVTDPADWSGLELLAATVLLEAEGEPDEGKLAVAWVVRTRMDAKKATVHDVALAPYQFSCWNADGAGMRKARLTAPDPVNWERCWRAAAGALWRMLPDPTARADHYLNEQLTRETRSDGGLPSWFDSAKVTARLGHHTFLRLG
jgi:N-acetylmuramoyl-L-alanine amidase